MDTGTQQTIGLISHEDADSDTLLEPTGSDGIDNPLNLRVSDTRWLHKQPVVAGQKFERFKGMVWGFRAGMKNVLTQARKTGSHSFNDTINILSPASDQNNIPKYIKAVQAGNVDTTASIADMSPDEFKAMIKAMAYHEQKPGFVVNEADIDAAYDSIFNNN